MKDFEIKPGLSGLLSFCEYLEKNKITYSIHKYSDDALTVFLRFSAQELKFNFLKIGGIIVIFLEMKVFLMIQEV